MRLFATSRLGIGAQQITSRVGTCELVLLCCRIKFDDANLTGVSFEEVTKSGFGGDRGASCAYTVVYERCRPGKEEDDGEGIRADIACPLSLLPESALRELEEENAEYLRDKAAFVERQNTIRIHICTTIPEHVLDGGAAQELRVPVSINRKCSISEATVRLCVILLFVLICRRIALFPPWRRH